MARCVVLLSDIGELYDSDHDQKMAVPHQLIICSAIKVLIVVSIFRIESVLFTFHLNLLEAGNSHRIYLPERCNRCAEGHDKKVLYFLRESQ